MQEDLPQLTATRKEKTTFSCTACKIPELYSELASIIHLIPFLGSPKGNRILLSQKWGAITLRRKKTCQTTKKWLSTGNPPPHNATDIDGDSCTHIGSIGSL